MGKKEQRRKAERVEIRNDGKEQRGKELWQKAEKVVKTVGRSKNGRMVEKWQR